MTSANEASAAAIRAQEEGRSYWRLIKNGAFLAVIRFRKSGAVNTHRLARDSVRSRGGIGSENEASLASIRGQKEGRPDWR